ncbi:Ig-like domain-containing protein, partial [Photobacterium lipolyticum]
SLSGFAGSGTTYTATFTPDSDRTAAATIDVAANTFIDAAGNNNTAAIQLSITLDTAVPSISIASDTPSLKAGETASLIFTLSEASSDFAASDITVVGGSLGDFAGSGTGYTATFTPDSDRTAAATIDVAANAFTDSAGNTNTAATQLSITIDTAVPTISIASDKSSLKAGETAALTFTLSESSSDFAASDITVVGGSLSDFAGSGTTYTAIFTPDSDRTAAATIDVAANTFIDAAGNNNTAATQLSISLDTVLPGISIGSDTPSLKAGETAALTFTLTEGSSDFAASDITVVGGSLSGFSGSGTTYTAIFTPDTDRTAAATIDVVANAFTDSAGNNNTAATRLSISLDTVLPTISIASDTPSLKAGEIAALTFILTEASSDFAVGDITVVGGSLSGFAGSGTTYTATFTPDTDRTAAATIDVAANAFTDSAGNNNTAAIQLSITLDTLLPTISIASNKPSLKAGETASLTFTLSEASSDFAASDIIVVGGSLSGFSGSGTTYTATFTPDTDRTAAATIDVEVNAFTDSAGNNNTAAIQLSISLDTVLPTISIGSDTPSLKAGETASLTFTLSEASPDFAVGDITVVGGSLSGFAGSGTTYTATFTPDSDRTATATIDVAANAFIDAAGNNNTAATQLSITLDTAVPTISIASDKASLKAGEIAALTFILTEASSDFAVGDITVVGGSLSGFAGSGTTYTASFTPDTDRTAAATIDVAANAFTDSAGNNNTAANRLSINLDTVLPTISIGSDTPSLKAGETASLTFTLSESSPDFAVGDITVVGGSLSGFAGSGTSYTATFTPDTDRTAAATIDVAASAFIDAAGNNNTAATQLSITLDTAVPTISIGSDTPSLKAGETASLTFTLSEASPDFAVGDITVVGGSLSDFAGSGTGYSATLTPSDSGMITVDVAKGVFTDMAGNESLAADRYGIYFDGLYPYIQSLTPDDDADNVQHNASLVLVFNEAVVAGAGSVRIYDESDDSLLETIHLSGEQAVIDGATLTIDLKTLFTPTHSYYVHISADALIDTAGNAFGGIDDTSSYNFTIGNNVPVLTDDAKSVAEDNSVAIVVLDNDSDSDSVINLASVTVTTQPVHGSTKVNTGTGVVTYSPDKDFAGTDSFYYRVEDVYGGLSEAAKVTITVTAVDDDPVANADMASTDEELAVLIDVLANDTDPDQGDSADSDTLAIVSQPEHGAVAIEEGQIRYEPDANYAGSDVFTYTVRDTSDRQSNTAEVRINIAGVNDAPVTVVDSAVTNEDMPVEISVLSNDSDIDGSVDVSTVAIVSQPEKGKVVVSELGMVTYTPEVNYYGSDSFTYVVQDNEDATSEATAVSLTVNSINDAPVASDDVATLLEDSTHSINVLGNDNDIDGQLDSSSVVVFSQPEQGSVSVAESGAILFTPIINFSGEDSFTYQVRDDLGMISNIATVMFTVQPVNDAPLANDDNASTQEDNAITINVIANDSDVDGSLDTTTLKISAAPKSGSLIDNSDGTVTYKPNENSQGSDSFSYTISDNEGEESNSATVMIDVEAVNDTPVVKDETLDEEYSEQNRFEIDVLENDSDIDGDTLTIIAASASIGEVIINDDKLTYQAPAGFTGNVELQYLVSDGNGESVQATVTLVINGKAELGIPIITVPDDIEVNATALFTRVDLGVATARDTDGEALPVSLRGSQIFFTPGKNIAYWRTEDAQGNTAEASQKVTVYPLVTIAKDSETTEGTRHSVKVYLNGQSPIYPVDIPYSVSGSANQYDHDLRDGKVTIEHGTVGKIEFNIFQDAENESDEALTITLDPSLNLGSKTEYTLRISEKNIAPKVTTSIVQQAEVRQIIVNNNEPVTISTEVTDANVDDSHQYIWSSDEPLIVNTSQVPEQFIFTPAQLNPGIYHFKLTVKDDGSEPLFVSKDIYLEVIEALASLGSEDTDGDLIPDNEEGFSDNDNDGIPDYQDAISECNVIQEQVSESVRYLVEGEAGVCLRKGITVASNITGGTHLLDNEVSEQLEVDQEADNIGGVFDFVAYGLPQAGQSYKVVFPQRLPIPVNAVYRKYIDGTGWRDFVIDDYNELSSTPGERGYCPPPGDESWVIGLNQGHWCVQLRIEDGGPNDDDGIANGSVVDPGGVAARVSKNTLPVAQNDAISMSLNSNITIDVLANDSDADGNVLDIANAVADFGTVDIINNQLYYTAEDHFYGVATISYSITDNSGGTSFADVTVNVVNSLSPVATDDQAQADDKTALLINVLANDSDPDGDSLTVIAAEAQNGQVIINTDQTLTYMPKEGFEGVDTITYRIRDLNGLEDTAVVRVQVSLKRSVVVENKSGGGIGGGMLLLTLLGLTRHYRWKRWLGLLLLLSFNSQANWFVESDLGLSKAHERSAVKADTVIDSDDSDFYWTVGIGYSINPRWSVAARYIDQGQGSATISNSTASPDEYHQSVALVVPVLASGVGVDVSYSAWQADAFNFAVSVGGMYWKADFDSVYQGNSLHYSDEGVDPYLGVELGYDINSQWTVGLGVTRYLIEANDVDAFSLKLKYRMDIEKN